MFYSVGMRTPFRESRRHGIQCNEQLLRIVELLAATSVNIVICIHFQEISAVENFINFIFGFQVLNGLSS